VPSAPFVGPLIVILLLVHMSSNMFLKLIIYDENWHSWFDIVDSLKYKKHASKYMSHAKNLNVSPFEFLNVFILCAILLTFV